MLKVALFGSFKLREEKVESFGFKTKLKRKNSSEMMESFILQNRLSSESFSFSSSQIILLHHIAE